MDKTTKGIIIGLVIGLIIGGIAGYFSHNFLNRGFAPGRGNFQINENTKQEITNFFDSNPDNNSVNSYCQKNRMNCF